MPAVVFEVDLSDLKASVEDVQSFLNNPKISRPVLQELGDFYVLRIITRTNQGADFKGAKFEPYSDMYADFRVSRGRNASPVDLTMSGKMLNALDATVTPQGDVLLFFNNAERGQIAWYHNASLEEDPRVRQKIPHRRFVDLDENGQDAKQMATVVRDAIANHLNRV